MANTSGVASLRCRRHFLPKLSGTSVAPLDSCPRGAAGTGEGFDGYKGKEPLVAVLSLGQLGWPELRAGPTACRQMGGVVRVDVASWGGMTSAAGLCGRRRLEL